MIYKHKYIDTTRDFSMNFLKIVLMVNNKTIILYICTIDLEDLLVFLNEIFRSISFFIDNLIYY